MAQWNHSGASKRHQLTQPSQVQCPAKSGDMYPTSAAGWNLLGMELDSIHSQTRSSQELPLVQFRGTLTPVDQNLVCTG